MQYANRSLRRGAPWFVLLSFAAASLPAFADDAKQQRTQWNGSYAQSCSDISVDKHGRLSATCRRTDGKSNRSNITPKQCPSRTAANSNGQLVCEVQANAGNGGNAGTGRWQGSFTQSCRDFSVNSAGTLTASCQARNGSWQRSSLAAVNCTTNRAENDDGQLVCESQRVGEYRWDGSFERTCRDIYMNRDGTLTATCQSRTGAWVPARLSARDCPSYTAANSNGQLVCESQGNSGSGRWAGSFAQSCRDISTDASGVLTATCQSTTGAWIPARLSANGCGSYRAANMNGKLVCESPGSVAGRGWDGSFKQSCRDISVNADGTLRATCQSRSGAWQQSSLARVNCADNRAQNVDGRLACESQRVSSNRWDGSYEKSCRDIYMDEAGTLTAKCQSTTGAWVPAQLSARECGSYRAANDNGRLVCEQQASQRR